MDIGLIAGLVTVFAFLYLLIWGQKSIKEILDERKKKRGEPKTSSSFQKSVTSPGTPLEQEQAESLTPKGWYLAHPYPMSPNFTGRVLERKMLMDWLQTDNENRLFILRALGGFGKSALIWHWLTHDIDSNEWTKVLWWSFYEGDASFENFIKATLEYLKLEVPQGGRLQVDELFKAMQSQKILLIMDGFERALRAYSSMNAAYQGDDAPAAVPGGGDAAESSSTDCVNINAEIFLKSVCSLPDIKSKLLMTTRLTPRAVKPRGEFMLGCYEEELTAMQKEDAVEFFRKQKIKGTHAEIAAACAPYGYHPLSLRLLAGRILKDFDNPADIVVAQKLKIDGDLKQHQQHVLKVSYSGLPPHEQKLLGTIACFRSPVDHKTLESISENKDSLDDDLHDLVERGLLHFDEKNKKFDLHPIVRRYAYDSLTAPDHTAAHARLRDYFAAVDAPAKPQTLDDLAPLIELYHHTVMAGKLDEGMDMYYHRLKNPLYYQFGVYQTTIELLSMLFPHGEDKLPRLEREDAQAWTLNELACAYSLNGQPRHAVPVFHNAVLLAEKMGNKKNTAIGLENVAGMAHIYIGALDQAERDLRHSIDLCREIGDEKWESVGHQELGLVLSYRGMWDEAQQEYNKAYSFFDKKEEFHSQSVVMAYHSWHTLLMIRDPTRSSIENRRSAITHAQQALRLADEGAGTYAPYERDFIRAHWLLGAAYRLNRHLDLAERHLSEALTRCRAINLIESEADILLGFARLHDNQKNYEEAKSLAEEALTITERCGYVLQGADVNLFLAQYALEQEKDKVKAREYAETTLKLARCDGPPYYYKVAYHEAERLLRQLA